MRRLLDGQDLAVFLHGEVPVNRMALEMRYMLLTWHGGGGLVAKIEFMGAVGNTNLYHVGYMDGADEGNVFAFVWEAPNGK